MKLDTPGGAPGHAREGAPLVPDVGVIMLVPDRWGRQWQVRHQVASRLARYFHVVWVNPEHEWRESFRAPRTGGVVPIAPNLDVYTPEAWLPRFHRPGWLRDLTLRTRLAHARARLLERGSRRVLLYVWRPRLADALRHVEHDASFYHIDDEYSFSSSDRPVSPVEAALIRGVDQVFIHSPELLRKKGHLNPHTAHVPNGVDFDAFARPAPVPADLAAIPRPRIGYTGWVKDELDWTLLAELAARHPEWSFVLVGGDKVRQERNLRTLAALRARANVHFPGAKSTVELTRYPQHFDVCVMPYVLDGYTRYIYPLKLHEYLAAGRPVVGTPIPSLQPFGGVVTLAEGADAWSAALGRALEPAASAPLAVEARQAVARRHDWDALVHRIASIMLERLGGRADEAGPPVGSGAPVGAASGREVGR